MTHICASKLTSIGADNGLAPARRQAIIWTNDGILLIGPSGTNFIEILFEIHTFSFKKIHLKMSSGKWRPFCLGLNVLIRHQYRANHAAGPVLFEAYLLMMLSLICAWINGWVNNGEAGDLRRHRAHYDANVMQSHYTAVDLLTSHHYYIRGDILPPYLGITGHCRPGRKRNHLKKKMQLYYFYNFWAFG